MFEANSTSSALNSSLSKSVVQLAKKMEDIAGRLTVIETHPREVLIKQIESIHQEV